MALESAPDEAFALTDDGAVTWQGVPVARLVRGAEPLRPALDLPANELLSGERARRLQVRLMAWLERLIVDRLAPLLAIRAAEGLSGPARGVAYQVAEALGTLPRAAVADQLAALAGADRKALARLNLRLGVESVFVPPLMKPEAQRLLGILWAVGAGVRPPPPPPPGRVSFRPEGEALAGWSPEALDAMHRAIGYRLIAGRAVRADMLERFTAALRAAERDHTDKAAGVPMPDGLASMLGLSSEELGALCPVLGVRTWRTDAGALVFRIDRHGSGKKGRPRGGRTKSGQQPSVPSHGRPAPADSPFAVLADKVRAG